jgi:hypothetical protein
LIKVALFQVEKQFPGIENFFIREGNSFSAYRVGAKSIESFLFALFGRVLGTGNNAFKTSNF